MYFDFTMVDVTPELSELRIVEHDEDVPQQHVRVGVSQKLAKRLGFAYQTLPTMEESTTDMCTYYAVTAGDDEVVLIQHSLDNDPESIVIAEWEDYLTNGRGEFGPFVFAMFDEWLDQDKEHQRYQLTKSEFNEQSDWPWLIYQAPRSITKRIVQDHRDFQSSVIDDVRKTVQQDLQL